MTKICPVCKREVKVIAGYNHARLDLHGSVIEHELYCGGSYQKVKVTPKQKKSLR
jgi:C4-type Zn-finger protein